MSTFRKPPTDRGRQSPPATFDPVPSIPKSLYRDPDPNSFSAIMARAPKYPRVAKAAAADGSASTFPASQPSPAGLSRKRKLDNARTTSTQHEPPASQDTAMAKRQRVGFADAGPVLDGRAADATNNQHASFVSSRPKTKTVKDFMDEYQRIRKRKSPKQRKTAAGVNQDAQGSVAPMAVMAPTKTASWTTANSPAARRAAQANVAPVAAMSPNKTTTWTAANTSSAGRGGAASRMGARGAARTTGAKTYQSGGIDYEISSDSDDTEIQNYGPNFPRPVQNGAHKNSPVRSREPSRVASPQKAPTPSRAVPVQVEDVSDHESEPEQDPPVQDANPADTREAAAQASGASDESEAEQGQSVQEPNPKVDKKRPDAYPESPVMVKQGPPPSESGASDDESGEDSHDDSSEDGENDYNRLYLSQDLPADNIFDSSQWANGPNEGGLLGSDYEMAETSSESSEEESSDDDTGSEDEAEDSEELNRAAASQIEQEYDAANSIGKTEGRPKQSPPPSGQGATVDGDLSETTESENEQEDEDDGEQEIGQEHDHEDEHAGEQEHEDESEREDEDEEQGEDEPEFDHESEPSPSLALRSVARSEEVQPRPEHEYSTPTFPERMAALRSSSRRRRAMAEEPLENTATQSPRRSKRPRPTKAQTAQPAAADPPARTASRKAVAPTSFTDVETATLMQVVEAFADGHHLSMDEAGALIRAKIPDPNCPGGADAQKQLWELVRTTFPGRKTKRLTAMVKRKFNIYGNGEPWTKEDDQRLRELVDKYKRDGSKWVKIGEELGRYSEACRDRYRNHARCAPDRDRGKWTPEQLDDLFDCVGRVLTEARLKSREEESEAGEAGEAGDDQPLPALDIDWVRVSRMLGGKRSRQQCLHKWNTLRIDTTDQGVWNLLCGAYTGLSPTLRAARLQLCSMSADEAAEVFQAVAEYKPDRADKGRIVWRKIAGGAVAKKWLAPTLSLLWARLRSNIRELKHLTDQEFAREVVDADMSEVEWLDRMGGMGFLQGDEEEIVVKEQRALTAALKGKKTRTRVGKTWE